MEGLWTTQVGSLPKPQALVKARTDFARGRLPHEELEALERQYTQFWIEHQNGLGLDIVVDAEMYRGDMATFFAEMMDGMEISGLVRSYGNRYYRKPIAVGTAEASKVFFARLVAVRPKSDRQARKGDNHRPRTRWQSGLITITMTPRKNSCSPWPRSFMKRWWT